MFVRTKSSSLSSRKSPTFSKALSLLLCSLPLLGGASAQASNISEFVSSVVSATAGPNIVTNTSDSGAGSLRAALQYANSNPNTTIQFNIPTSDAGYSSATGVYTINLITALDSITANGTVIDGSSQTAFGGNSNPLGPEVQLLGIVTNINPNGGGFGSVINGFRIETGLQIEGSNCAVNGLIINNFKTAIYLLGGILQGKNNTIRGCYIGLDYTGNTAMTNWNNDYKFGVSIQSSSNNTIGGLEPGQGNRIAYSAFQGVYIAYGTGNSVRGNSIFGNLGLGIDLNDPAVAGGISPNDANDVDTGSNSLQNFPVINSVTSAGGNTSVSLSLNSIANKTYAIDVYRMPPSDVDYTGYGEGTIYAGTVNLTTDATGNGTATLNISGVFANQSYSATATDSSGNTSEFSFAFNPGGDSPAVVKNTGDSGTGSFRAAIQYANGNPVSTISFAIPKSDPGYNATTGVYTIRLTSALDPISGAGTVIDGSTQTAIENTNPLGPEIEITSNGYATGYGLRHGLQLTNANSTIKNLIVNGFRIPIGVRSHLNKVLGCYIGTDATGTSDSPNNYPSGSTSIMEQGIELFPSDSVTTNHQIGGLGAGEGNRIAFSKGSGVTVQSYICSNTIRGNSIFKNGGVGIDLGGNGLTSNDVGDGDSDANLLQNFPIISSVATVGGNTQVALSLNSIANQTFIIDLYRTPFSEVSQSGFGVGKTYAGTVNITTDASGNGSTTATIAGSIGTDVVTATATDASGNTSELSGYVANNSSSPLIVTTTADDGIGSFRKALQFANGNGGGTITFNIPTSDSGFNPTTGVWTISSLDYLPRFAAPIVVDGTSQPGNTNTHGPEIELSGAAASLYYGPITAPGTVIRGLMINGFSTPLVLQGGTTVESCYIGTDYTGTAPSPNNNVRNNYENGIDARGEGNVIGGDTEAKRNVIGFTTDSTKGNGIFLYSQTRNNLIRNNSIIGNSGAGIGFSTLMNSRNAIRDNLIRDNAGAGISLPSMYDGNQNTIRFNSIVNNGGLGIDLGADGVTPNDAGDEDPHALPNHGLNQPVLTGISVSGSDVLVTGTYNSRPNSTFEIDFYSSAVADASGFGEGQTFLGTVSVQTDANGNANFSKVLTTSLNSVISATATVINNPADDSSNGDTSEFSNNLTPPAGIYLGSPTYTVSESGTNAIVTVVRAGSVSGSASVNYSIGGGSATAGTDYTASSGTINWADGDGANKTITIPIKTDSLDESDETFNITLSGVTGSAPLVEPSSAVVTITDDDTLGISAKDVSIVEGTGGTKTVTFTVSLGATTDKTVTVKYATANGTAMAGTDYVATSGTLTFTPGQISKAVVVTINGDAITEAAETFVLNLSEATNAPITDEQAVCTITDDDALPVLSVNSPSISEGNTGTKTLAFTVKLTPASNRAVSFYARTTPTASTGTTEPATAATDFVALPQTLYTLNAGETSKVINITINGDVLDEANETFNLVLSSPSYATLGASTGVGTITDDDLIPSLSINDVSLTEANTGTQNAAFTVSLSSASGRVVKVTIASLDVTTTAGADYIALPATVLTFLPGQTSKVVNVAVKGDTLSEITETFQLKLSAPVNAVISDTTGIGTIIDNDPIPAISATVGYVTEGNSGQVALPFTIKLSNPSSRVTTVKVMTVPASVDPATSNVDFVAVPVTTVTIPAGTTQQVFNVQINGDLADEINEHVALSLSVPTNATVATPKVEGIIIDDDDAPSLSVTGGALDEGNSGAKNLPFTVSLSKPSGKTVTVNFQTTSAGTDAATAGTDYIAVAATKLTFAPGETTKTINVAVKGDTQFEKDEFFNGLIGSAANASVTKASDTGLIRNDDTMPGLSIVATSITEGNTGTKTTLLNLTLTAAAGVPLDFTYETTNDTALAGEDYVAQTGTLSFSAGQTTRSIAIVIKGDTTFEANERFFVDCYDSRSVNYRFPITIVNDDSSTAKSGGSS